MHFQLSVMLTEEDYLAFNRFHATESQNARKQIRNTRILFIASIALILLWMVWSVGWTPVSITYVVLVSLFTILYTLLFKKIMYRILVSNLKKLKKTGKLPFDPVSTLEFHEDRIIEITEAKHIEQLYRVFERICVVKDRYIYLYTSSVQAYILPISQLNAQLGQEEFIRFISQKCNHIEYY